MDVDPVQPNTNQEASQEAETTPIEIDFASTATPRVFDTNNNTDNNINNNANATNNFEPLPPIASSTDITAKVRAAKTPRLTQNKANNSSVPLPNTRSTRKSARFTRVVEEANQTSELSEPPLSEAPLLEQCQPGTSGSDYYPSSMPEMPSGRAQRKRKQPHADNWLNTAIQQAPRTQSTRITRSVTSSQ